ncbi:MAG: hypothetical protein AAFP20_10350 [Cyanobacteria bacterium J06614_10]
MPRLIILLLTLVALAVLALQNLSTTVSLVVLSGTLPELPLGILLVCAVGIGAFLTLILYGLVSLRRPPESKYRPMGRRVPYPNSPGSSTLPPSGPPYKPEDSTVSGSGYGSTSSAFVSEPATTVDPAPASPPPQDTPIQDRYAQDSYSDSYAQDSYAQDSYAQDSYAQDSYAAQDTYSQAPPSQDTYRSQDTYQRDTYGAVAEGPAPNYGGVPRSNISQGIGVSGQSKSDRTGFPKQPLAGLKSVFGKKKDRNGDEPAVADRPVGDDWGELRTTAQRNSWEVIEGERSNFEAGARELLKFGRDVGTHAGRLAEDIATGWNNRDNAPPGAPPEEIAGRAYPAEGYDAYYADDSDYTGDRSEGYEQAPGARKRTYGESLYDDPDARGTGEEGDYPAYEDADGRDEIGPDGVYEADFRVLEPPSKPLSDEDQDYA